MHLPMVATLACALATVALPLTSHAQLDSTLKTAVTGTSAPTAHPEATSRHTQMALGAVGGAVLGGLAGYVITKGACNSCDDAGPLWFGALLGGVGGATVGVVIARSSSNPVASETRQPLREARRLNLGVRVVRDWR